jgi:hypothetical protein
MITFSPIQKLIQETLHQKMKMLDKVPSNQTGINEPTTGDGGVPQENYMFARSVFLRMTSLLTRNNKPIVLMGGELFEGQYRKGLSVYGPKSGGVKEENPNLRPMAGVKDVNVEYAGGGMKIGATRKTSISWTCWTWDELQKFKPFFLTHGKNVLIEFGWGFQGSDAPMMLDIIKENGEINEDLINGISKTPFADRESTLQAMIPEYILEQKGHYDAVLGTIDNFEFSVNETGGFDCTTSLVSMGVNTMRRMDSKESVDGHIANLPIVSPKSYWFKTDESSSSQIADKNPYYSFKSYMMSLEGHLHLNALNSKGSIAYILGGDTPYCTWGWFEDNVLSRFAGQINADKNSVVGEFRSIENIYDDEGKQIDVQPTMMRVSRQILPIDFSPKGWFWVYPEQVTNDRTDFWKDTTLRQDNSKLIPDVKSYNNSNGILGDFKLMFAPPYLQPFDDSLNGLHEGLYGAQRWKKSFLGSVTATWNDDEAYFRPFKNDISSNGVIRNIYFGHEFLTECFDKSTIKEGIDSVWSKFSAAYGGIYDFGIEFDDKEGRLMIKDREFANKKVSKVLENTSRNPTSVDTGYQNDGVFVFPIWEKNSIVKSQNLSAKLPSRMQVAAMYGNNSPEVGDGLIDTMEDWGAVALGRNEREVEEDENKEQKLLDSLLGSVEEPFRRSTTGKQYTFGNATANDNEPLRWKDTTSSDTTDIYEDLSDKDLSALNDSFGKGINEVMDVVLTKEFEKRLLELSGLETQEEYDEGIKSGIFGGTLSLADQEKKAQEKIDTFTSSTTNKGAMKLLYGNFNKENKKLTSVEVYQDNYHAEHLKWPVMKAEYHGLLKSTLKGEDGGIVKTTDPLVPIELEIEIDGTGGIFPGNSFHSSYLPQSYMERMCFQVIGASHRIDSAGWTTTLKGQMRVSGREKVEPPERIEDVPGVGVLRPEVFEELPKVKKIREKEKKDAVILRSITGDLIGDLNENVDIKPDISEDKKEEVKEFEKKKKEDPEKSFYESLKAKFTKKKTKKITKSVSTPAGEIKAVNYNDQTTGFSADVARQFNFRKPMD